MKKFALELLFRITGIGAASGLVYNDGNLWLIADNSHILYEYNIEKQSLEKTALVNKEYLGPQENIPKKDKPDYEAITIKEDSIYLVGSGSGENRNLIGHVDLKTKKLYPHIDATDLYLAMQGFAEITPEDFNIEAAVNDGTTWYLLNRGNGPKKQNGIFTLNGTMNNTSFQIVYNPIKLPKINGVQATFTDACLADGKLYFVAAAENTTSTYADGAVAGTLLGRMNLDKMKVEKTVVISEKNKFEGITVFKETDKEIDFLLCEDTDSNITESAIYKLSIKK
jgi:hypothetical protein